MIPMLDPTPPAVFVTDATSGFRAAICQRFHEAGARIIATGRPRNALMCLRGNSVSGAMCSIST
jgi:3-hydroxy acid dehydrogenase / malonic semialdehyde reductase